ncbi:unnamed protein product [marine sediment metagenome]|uniref:Uncharacterized protein n=1 Tax=marine sediment metagenome TaxID=412755 RepID=X1I814_9ZZZZ
MITQGAVASLRRKLAAVTQQLAHGAAVDKALVQRAREIERKLTHDLKVLRRGEARAATDYQRQWFRASYQELLSDRQRARRVQSVILQRQAEQKRREAQPIAHREGEL